MPVILASLVQLLRSSRWLRRGSLISERFISISATSRVMRKTRMRYAPEISRVCLTLVAGITTTAAFKVYGEVLLHPDQISAKFESWFLALLAALTFAVATLGINVVANFLSPAFDFANVFPRTIDLKKGGYIAALIALVLYPFAPWEGGAAQFVNFIGSTMGPIFGVMMADYYLIRKGHLHVEALYDENGEFRFSGGWNIRASSQPVLPASSRRSYPSSQQCCRRGGVSMAGSSVL